MANILRQLGQPPRESKFHSHIWCDYLELLCLTHIDQCLSKNDVIDHIRNFDQDLPSGDIGDTDNSLDVDKDEDDLPPAEINDKWSTRTADWFTILLYREAAFGTSYPFKLNESQDVLEVKNNLSLENKLYVFLLLCSSLRYCKNEISTLTKTFERLSADVMKEYLADNVEVHIFGTSATEGGRYTGSLWEKINKLATDLGEVVRITKDDLPKSDSGDGGLDIVAWVPSGDDNSHKLVFFGQCACTMQWDIKQYSASGLKWQNTLSLGGGVSSLTFIPHALRKSNGAWHDISNIATIMVDRLRFIHTIKNKIAIFQTTDAYPIIEQALMDRSDIF